MAEWSFGAGQSSLVAAAASDPGGSRWEVAHASGASRLESIAPALPKGSSYESYTSAASAVKLWAAATCSDEIVVCDQLAAYPRRQ